MMRGPGQLGQRGGWRRIMALLAVTAWVLAVAVCPEMPEAFAAMAQPTLHGDRVGPESEHPDKHASCHRAAHASAVLHFSKAIRAGGLIGAPAAPVTAVAQPALAVPIGPAVALTRAIDGPPRPRNVRFASFWPHAPPLTL